MWLDIAITAFAAATLPALWALRGVTSDWLVQAATFALVAVAGVLGGLVFPLASVLLLQTRRGSTLAGRAPGTACGHAVAGCRGSTAGRAAASVDAADNAGACLGAFITGALLVPILGVSGACVVVLAVKALSGLLVGLAVTMRPAGSPPPSPSA
jgi:hypothetical protein